MATVLEKYRQYKQSLQQQMEQGGLTANTLWKYGEVVYRISALETCQAFRKSVPVTTDMGPLTQHYQMLDSCVQCLAQERSYGPSRGPDTEKERNAARTNLSRVIDDYRRQFSSFTPTYDFSYEHKIDRVINLVIPAWIQMRETFVPLREEKKEEQARDRQ